MDRASRLQNGVPLGSGSLNRPPLIQGDGLGMKVLQLSILDRFRAMMKEREEELGILRGGRAFPLSTDEIVRLYEILLSELTINSKPIITDLTIIAGEQREHAEGIADAICSRIIEVRVDHKLPSLYLLDSIVKNIGKEYITYFSACLPEVFCEAYLQAQANMHVAMRHLFRTWSSVFPSSVLQRIEEQLQFPPSVNAQSSGMSSSKASESPQPTHGIHINPKYLDAHRKFGNSTNDSFGTEGVSSTGRAGVASTSLNTVKKSLTSAPRITNSSPYSIGHTGSLLPSLEEFNTNGSPSRVSFRASPSHSITDYGLSRVGRDEEIVQRPKRSWLHSPSRHLKESAANKHSSSVDLRGPRALISAYGIDEREKDLYCKHPNAEQLDTNGADRNVSVRTWQNTEEEEFDWEDMTPALADRRQSNDMYTSHPPFGISTSGRGLSDKIARPLPNVAGRDDLTNRILPHSFDREALSLPHQPAQRIPFENISFLTAADQKPPAIRSFSNIDRKFGGGSSLSTYELPAPSVSLAYPATRTEAHFLAQMAIRGGQFGVKSAASFAVDQDLSKIVPSEQHFGGSMAGRPSFVQPNYLMDQEGRQNLPMHSSVPPPPDAPAPHLIYGYLAQAQGPRNAFQPMLRAPGPGPTQALNLDRVAPSPPAGGALTGLISSLMEQGLISLSKQDSIGVDFDQDNLKVRHESVITALYVDLPRQCTTCGLRFKSQEEHSKHMDWHVNKNRSLRNRKAKPSPKWFVSVNMWLTGAEALGTESVPGFFPTESTVEKKDEEELAVPADEDQDTCALCGEPFDDFYSDETEEWMYRGAVYIHAPLGPTVGVDRSMLGPIVHAKCRPDSHGISSDDFKRDETESIEEGSRRKKMRY